METTIVTIVFRFTTHVYMNQGVFMQIVACLNEVFDIACLDNLVILSIQHMHSLGLNNMSSVFGLTIVEVNIN